MPNAILMVAELAWGVAAIVTLVTAFFTVESRTIAIVERLGKPLRKVGPGLHIKVPFVDRVAGRLSLRFQQSDIEIETETEDNVLVHLVVAVQYYVLPHKAYDALYKLNGVTQQITSIVFDFVRARVRQIKLDDVFEKKDDIADVVRSKLAQVMEGFGYGILKIIVTQIDADSKRVATVIDCEPSKAVQVRAGAIERQREAISSTGNGESNFWKLVPATTANDVVNRLLVKQYFAVLKRTSIPLRSGAVLHAFDGRDSLARSAPVAMIGPELLVELPVTWGESLPKLRIASARSQLQQAWRNR